MFSNPSVKSGAKFNDTDSIKKGKGFVKNKEHDHIISDLWKNGFILGFICGTLTTGSLLTFMRILYE